MRRFFLLLTIGVLILTGCGTSKNKKPETVTFYYLEKEFDFHGHSSILAPEVRDISDHRQDLGYLLSLYQVGPAEENHRSPLPAGTRIHCQAPMDNALALELSESARTMTDADFSLAAACLSQTCFAAMDTESVTVINGERRITMQRDSLLLVDELTQKTATEETS